MLIDGPSPSTGRFCARLSRAPADVEDALSMRSRAFGAHGGRRDRFDDQSDHLLIHEAQSGDLVCCARVQMPQSVGGIDHSYSAQFYDLSALEAYPEPMAEIGRFCIDPTWSDPDVLRAAWAALAAYVDENNIGMLFGCSSFTGVETQVYLDTFALLKARHLAPRCWRPRVRSPEVYRFDEVPGHAKDWRQAVRAMPPLLRSYLMMGGWVSDHVVVDRQMSTLHVFTGLEIKAIPATRKRLLRVAMDGI